MEWVKGNKELYEKARTELMRLPNVIGCGYGLKERNSLTTKEICIRVYVKTKKNLADLEPEDRIPEEVYGFRTDVLKILKGKDVACQDLVKHEEVMGGITLMHTPTILSGHEFAAIASYGTIGCVVSIRTINTRNHYGILTNNHVLTHRGGQKGAKLYQPRLTLVDTPSSGIIPVPIVEGDEFKDINEIGKIENIGLKGNYSFSYPQESVMDYYVDCGLGWLDTKISSCCHTVCGTKFNDRVLKMNLGPGNSMQEIQNVRRVTDSDIGKDVIKIGRTTGRTTGIIKDADFSGEFIESHGTVDPDDDELVIRNRIIIVEQTASDTECEDSHIFLDGGDSGSVLLDTNGFVIGLMYGSGVPRLEDSLEDRIQAIKTAYACHIHPVMDLLKIDILSAKKPLPENAADVSSVKLLNSPHYQQIALMEAKLNQTTIGSEILKRAIQNRYEVIRLINYNRSVMLAWQRFKGPAFLAHFIKSIDDPLHMIPKKINGISLSELLHKMDDVLTHHGSESLKKNIQKFRHLVPIVAKSGSLKNIIEKMNDVSILTE